MLRFSLLLLLVLPTAAAQRPPWTASARHHAEVFDGDREAWTLSLATVERRLRGGSVLASVGRASRFGQAATVGVADVYADLAPRTYGNARVAVAPGARTVARADAALTLYRALPGRLEGRVGARRVQYAGGGATLLSVGATRFARWGRLGAVGTVVPADSVVGVSLSALARLDLGPAADRPTAYVEVRGGRGEEVVPTPGGAADLRTSWTASVGAAWRRGRVTAGVRVGRAWDEALTRTQGEVQLGVDL